MSSAKLAGATRGAEDVARATGPVAGDGVAEMGRRDTGEAGGAAAPAAAAAGGREVLAGPPPTR
ncbi:MAG TPA: hypothetical protein RMF84_14790, partial [Polyangiaceae bacterium LLY-WYZ-14_1]|nr:hypothetical protein [Polyangiaceae bacterium LLY-WYZ-14_1]